MFVLLSTKLKHQKVLDFSLLNLTIIVIQHCEFNIFTLVFGLWSCRTVSYFENKLLASTDALGTAMNVLPIWNSFRTRGLIAIQNCLIWLKLCSETSDKCFASDK